MDLTPLVEQDATAEAMVTAAALPARPADPAEVAAVLRDGAFRFAPAAVALHPMLCDAAARLVAVARATGREVVVISARDPGGVLWHGASAGNYLYDSARPAWSDPRPGDADYLWGERARAVVESLAEAQWEQLSGPGRAFLCLVARAGGAWLALAGEAGGPAEFHAIAPDRPLELCGFQDPAESRCLAELFRAMAPLHFVTVERFAEYIVLGEPEPEQEPEQEPETGPAMIIEEAEEPVPDIDVEEDAPAPGLLARLIRRR